MTSPRRPLKRSRHELAAIAITAAEDAERIATEPCDAEVPSWEMFSPGTVGDYWMRCDRIGPHDEHEHSDEEIPDGHGNTREYRVYHRVYQRSLWMVGTRINEHHQEQDV